MEQITGIILCGGKSSRMGENKSLLKLGDKTIVEIIIDKIKSYCSEIIISTNNNDFDFLPYQKVPDKIKGIGPISGFHSCLTESKTEHNIFISGDTPFIPDELLSYLIQEIHNKKLALVKFENHIQPMFGYFNKSILLDIEYHISSKNMKPINIFENLNPKIIDIKQGNILYQENSFFNINTKSDYEIAIDIYKAFHSNEKKF